MAEYIDRDALIEHMKKDPLFDLVEQYGVTDVIESFPTADVQPVKWIPFRVRDLDEEEKADHPGWDWILDGELPEDGQRVLVNVKFKGHESVQMDEYYDDDGCYLDSGYEIGTEVTHWMPLPKPPKDGEA